VGFLFNTLHNLSGLLPVVLYLSYMSLLAWCLFMAMGTCGFLASYVFTYKIFEGVKAD
jgi:transmembrane 9 superfamily protein 2/4